MRKRVTTSAVSGDIDPLAVAAVIVEGFSRALPSLGRSVTFESGETLLEKVDRAELTGRETDHEADDRFEVPVLGGEPRESIGLAFEQELPRGRVIAKMVGQVAEMVDYLVDLVSSLFETLGGSGVHKSSPCSVCGAPSVGEPPAAGDAFSDPAAGEGEGS